ncbi:MAG: HDOD domain-containing protein [Acidobacteriota bacterium]
MEHRHAMEPLAPMTERPQVTLNVNHFPPLPEVAWRVLELTSDLYSGSEELEEVIAHDQSLTTRLLRVANSAYFQRRREIKTVRQAVTVLGNQKIRGIVVAAALGGIFYKTAVGRILWQHALAVGVAARELSAYLPGFDPEEAFVLGLLHDLGKGILAHEYPVLFQETLSLQSGDPELTSCAAEQSVFGLDHTAAGRRLSDAWNLPQGLTRVIERHHLPAEELGDEDTAVRLIKAADCICNTSGLGVVKHPENDEGVLAAADWMQVGVEDLASLRRRFLARVAADAALFGMEIRC